MLEFDAAMYPTKLNLMIFAKQYLVGNTAAAWDSIRAEHSEVNLLGYLFRKSFIVE